jgi:hypothetical protein
MAEPTTTRDFVPIGVWVCNWADIFPWLATGYSHSIDDTTEAEIMVKARMMAQDFLTLNRLYRYAADVKVALPDEPAFKDGDGKVCGQIADSFASAYASLADAKPEKAADYKSAAAAAYGLLGEEAQKIYKKWDGTPCLRSAELGLGYIKGGRSLETRHQFNIGQDSNVYSQWIPVRYLTYYDDKQCTFGSSNFSAFAQFYKVLPLILPQSSKIIAFGEGGFIGAASLQEFTQRGGYDPGSWQGRPDVTDNNTLFSMQSGHAEFETDSHRGILPRKLIIDMTPIEFVENGNYLENTDHKIKLYPIPLSAASNINWTGQSFSTNVKADAVLNQRLEEIVKDLESSKVEWSWSSETLKSDWNAEGPYFPKALRKEYFGLAKGPSRKDTQIKPD